MEGEKIQSKEINQHTPEVNILIYLNAYNGQSTPSELLETMRSLIAEIRSYKTNNERLLKAHEEKQDINDVLL